MITRIAATLVLLTLLTGCPANLPPVSPQPPSSPPTSPASPLNDAGVAADWMDLSAKLVQLTNASPPVASRVYAYAGVALYQSLASVDPSLPSLEGKLNGLQSLPKPAGSQSLDGRWVAHAALKTLVPSLFHVSLSDEQQAEISALENRLGGDSRNAPQAAVPQAIRTASEAYGRQLGQALIAWCEQDQFKQLRTTPYTLPERASHPDYWLPTINGAKPLEPHWGKLRTFAISSGDSCHTAPSVGFSTVAESGFYKQALEVVEATKNLSDEQTAIARWWADNPGQTSTPPGHWIAIAGKQVRERKLDSQDTARLYASLGVAMADAFVSCWQSKYQVNLLRPMTYIRNTLGIQDWIPLLATPMFPEYPSGHSVSSAAAAEILTNVIGDVNFVDTTHIQRGMTARRFDNFHVAAQEAAVSRLYGGIHFRDAIDNGLKQGQCVGNQVLGKMGS